MGEVPATREVRLDLSGVDEEELEQDVAQLRLALLELEVESVHAPSGGPAPAGARADGVTEVGALLVTLLGTPGLLESTVGVVSDWLRRRIDRSVEITLDGDALKLSGASRAQQDRLIQAWLDRHG